MSNADRARISDRHIVVPHVNLSIDFANTLEWRGSTARETLGGLADLINWLGSANALPSRAIGDLVRWFEAHPRRAVAVYEDAIAIRETLYRLLRTLAKGASPLEDELQQLNRALSETFPRTKLERDGANLGWQIEVKPIAAGVLAPVLWSAADLLATSTASRLRECANERCLWLFIDDSKNGTRRWCSMQACGNRAKAHRHYLRHKEQ
jgi:predicted RNA-binding Zn ribbon-like protein